MTKHIDKTKFDRYIKSLCIVDFYTSECPNCQKQAEVFEALSEAFEGIAFYKVNLDDDLTLAERYDLQFVPTLMLFNKGVAIDEHVGFLDEKGLAAFILREEGEE